MNRIIAIVACVLVTPAIAFAQLEAFDHYWVNTDAASRSIKAVNIQVTRSGVRVRVWGACSPTWCDWGWTEAEAYSKSGVEGEREDANALVATYDFDFATTILVFKFATVGAQPPRVLSVETYTRFNDGSGRSPYWERMILTIG